MPDWYPQNKEELNKLLESLLSSGVKTSKKINGIIVPHAGYAYSGKISGKAFSLLKNQDNNKTGIILSPSHYIPLEGIISHNKSNWTTPLGNIKIINNKFPKIDISQEHAINNQIPFLQKLGFPSILPLIIGEITIEQAKNIAEELMKIKNATFIVSSDLSHFRPYEEAVKKDKETINTITGLKSEKLLKIENSACGIFPLLIFIELAKLKGWNPKLIEYQNSGDITGDKSSVVGYASFSF